MDNFDLSLMASGVTVAVVGMLIVFAALIFLWFSLSLISRIINTDIAKWRKKDVDDLKMEKTAATGISGETAAAISTAIYMYLREIHDEERTILTIRRHAGRYSPWSSKIYTVMGLNKKFQKKAA